MIKEGSKGGILVAVQRYADEHGISRRVKLDARQKPIVPNTFPDEIRKNTKELPVEPLTELVVDKSVVATAVEQPDSGVGWAARAVKKAEDEKRKLATHLLEVEDPKIETND